MARLGNVRAMAKRAGRSGPNRQRVDRAIGRPATRADHQGTAAPARRRHLNDHRLGRRPLPTSSAPGRYAVGSAAGTDESAWFEAVLYAGPGAMLNGFVHGIRSDSIYWAARLIVELDGDDNHRSRAQLRPRPSQRADPAQTSLARAPLQLRGRPRRCRGGGDRGARRARPAHPGPGGRGRPPRPRQPSGPEHPKHQTMAERAGRSGSNRHSATRARGRRRRSRDHHLRRST
jgi:hypothetical protein